MPYIIAVVGKGGVGKTTLSGMLVQYFSHREGKPVLAVDADSNSNLNEVLGLDISGSLGEIREEIADTQNEIRRSDVKEVEDYTLSKMDKAITKGDGYDILVMGRPQGAGCYCFANEILKRQIEKIGDNYTYVLVDNEAGMEHISRGLLPKIDVVIIVSDCSRRGVIAAGRIQKLVADIGYEPSVIGLVVNMTPNGVLDDGTAEEVKSQGLDMIGIIPYDEQVFSFDSNGIPLITLPEDSPVKTALNDIFLKIGV